MISRDTNSGTYETFETLVMNKEKIAADAEYVGSNGAVRAAGAEPPAARSATSASAFVDRPSRR